MFGFRKKQSPVPPGRRRPLPEDGRSSGVFSYHARRSAQGEVRSRESLPAAQTDRQRQLQLSSWMRRASNVGILFLIALLLVVSLRLSPTPKIIILNKNATNKAFVRSEAYYQEATRKVFASSLLNGNKLTVSTADITREIVRQFPEFSAASVTLPLLGHTPTLYLSPALPRLLLVTKTGGLFVIDENGRALINALQVPQLRDMSVPVVHDESGLEVTVSKPTLPSANVAFITEVHGQLKAKGIDIAKMTLPAGTSELHLQVRGAPYIVKFNLYGKAREEAGAFMALKKSLETRGKVPGYYIDVRVETRAYYR